MTGDRPGAADPQPFPNAERIAPWIAVSWRAFGSHEAPPHIVRLRSFDGGDVQLPDEGRDSYEARQEEHRRFDAAERELLSLLAAGRITAQGQPPARGANGKRLHAPALTHLDMPASTFLNQQLAFTAGGELIQRLPLLERMFPPLELCGSDATPEFPLYHDVLVKTAELRKLWEPSRTPDDIQRRLDEWMTKTAEEFLRRHTAKPKRADLVRDCVAALGCRHEDAEAAQGRLPTHLRRSRGERDKQSKSAG